MNETEKIPFHEKRRQHFLSEEKYQKEKNGYLSNLKFWDNNWQKSILESKHLFRYKFSEVFDYLRICYTAGESISLLSPMLDKIVSTLEVSTKFWQQNKAELNEIGYYTSPMPWFYAEYYLKTLHLIALCYLLQREDLLPRLLEVILANAEDGL